MEKMVSVLKKVGKGVAFVLIFLRDRYMIVSCGMIVCAHQIMSVLLHLQSDELVVGANSLYTYLKKLL